MCRVRRRCDNLCSRMVVGFVHRDERVFVSRLCLYGGVDLVVVVFVIVCVTELAEMECCHSLEGQTVMI